MFAFNETLERLVRIDMRNNNVPFLVGEAGIGKSSWTEYLASSEHTVCFSFKANEVYDKVDVNGSRLMPVYDDAGKIIDYNQVAFPHEIIREAMMYAEAHPTENPILFIDEINRTSPDVTSLLLSIPTDRKVANRHLPENLRIICAGNDKGNVVALDEASRTRFVIYHVTADVATFLAIHEGKLHPSIVETLTAHPDTLVCKRFNEVVTAADSDDEDSQPAMFIDDILADDAEMDQLTCPRTIEMLSDKLNSLDASELNGLLNIMSDMDNGISFLQEMVEGHVGHTLFSIHLMENLVNSLTAPQTSTAKATTAPRPVVYDQLKNATSRNDIDTAAAAMSDSDRSGCLVYAIWEKCDNSAIIQVLAPHVSSFAPDDTKTLMRLAAADDVDVTNLRTFLATQTPLAVSIEPVISTMVG